MTPTIGYLRLSVKLDASRFPVSILIQEYNQVFAEFFNISEARENELFETLPEVFCDDSERWSNILQQCAYHGQNREEIIKSANGIYQATIFAPIQGEVIMQVQELSLRQNDESIYKDILIQMSDAVFVTDNDGNFKQICPNVEFLFGFTELEVSELKNISNLLGADYRNHLFLEQDDTDELIKNHSQTVVDKNGELHHILVDVKRIYLPDPSLLFVCRDYTDQHYEINDLKKNSTYLKTIINTIPDLVWVKDKEGKYLLCNHEFELFFGSKEEEIIGKKDKDFVNLDLANLFRKHDLMAMNSKSSIINEEELTYKSGSQSKLVETTKTPVIDQQGQLLGVLGVSRDITQRNKIKEELTRSSEKLNTLINTVNGVIWEFDLQSRNTTFISQKIVDILGFPMEYWDENSLFGEEQIATDQIEHIFENIMAKMANWQPFSFELPFYHQQGHIVWIRTHVNFVGQKGSPQCSIIGLSIDITPYKNNIIKLTESERKFQHLFNATTDAIFYVDENGYFQDVNEGAWTRMGYERDELQGKFIGLVDRSINNHEQFMQIAEVLSNRKSSIFEAVHTTKTGIDVPVEVNVSVVTQDNVRMYIAIARDISDRRKSEYRFKSLFNAISDQIHYADHKGKFIDVNESTTRLLGYTKDELRGEFISKIDENFKSYDQFLELKKFLSDDKPFIFESVQTTKSGRKIPVEVSIVAAQEEGQDRYIAVCRDISERIKADEKFKSLFNAVNDQIHFTRSDGTILEVNETTSRVLGYKKEELIGQFLGLIDPNFSTPEQISDIAKDFGLNESRLILSENITKSGETIPVEINLTLIEYNGDPTFIAVIRDITDRHLYEEELRLRDSNLKKFFENVHVGIVKNSNSGDFIEVNPEFEKMTGYSADELFNMNVRELTPETYSTEDEHWLSSIEETGKMPTYQKHFITKSGDWIPVLINGVKTRDTQNNEYYWSVVQDVSESEQYKSLLQRDNFKLKTALNTGMLFAFEINLKTEQIETIRDHLEISSMAQGLSLLSITSMDEFLMRISGQQKKYCQKGYELICDNEIDSFECEMQLFDQSIYRWYFGKMIVIERDELERPSTAYMTLRDIEKEKNEKARQIIGQEQERLRISRDIHDSIGQMLVGTRMMLKSTGLDTPELQEIDELMTDMIKESRLIINNFGISVAQSKDLKSTFTSLAEKMGKIYYGDIIINWHGEVVLRDISQATSIFRIYQEALSNAIKYSNSPIIRVNVRIYDMIFMDIIDYGSGFEVTKHHEGFGTENMHARASDLKCTLLVESEIGKGTAVRLRPVY